MKTYALGGIVEDEYCGRADIRTGTRHWGIRASAIPDRIQIPLWDARGRLSIR